MNQRSHILVRIISTLVIPGLLMSHAVGKTLAQAASVDIALQKITFDPTQISSDGLVGKGDGRRSLSYEFCIPANETQVSDVRAIDPTIQIHRYSRGRIGCTRDQYLCIGQTHNPRWRQILLAIAQLDYVQRIDEFFGE